MKSTHIVGKLQNFHSFRKYCITALKQQSRNQLSRFKHSTKFSHKFSTTIVLFLNYKRYMVK